MSDGSISSRSRSVSFWPLAIVRDAELLLLLDDDPFQQGLDLAIALAFEDRGFVVEVALHPADLVLLDLLGPDALFGAAAAEDPDVDDRAFDAGGAVQRGVFDVQGLFPEDGLEELFLGRKLGLPFRGDLADQDVAGLDAGADADDAVFVEVAEHVLRDVGDVPGDVLGAELGVPGLDGLLDDVERSEDVVLDQLFGDDDRILEVVSPPGHEGPDDVAAEGQLAHVGAGAVGQHLSLDDRVALVDDRALGETGVLVGPEEFRQDVEVGPDFVILGLVRLVDLDEDPFGVDESDLPGPLADDDVARALGHEVLHARPDERGDGPQERHGLPLHVRAHQGAVGVVVLQEGNERRRQGHQLLGRNVDIIDLFPGQRLEVAGLPGRDQLVEEVAVLIHPGVGLGDDVRFLLPRGQVVAERLEDGEMFGRLCA